MGQQQDASSRQLILLTLAYLPKLGSLCHVRNIDGQSTLKTQESFRVSTRRATACPYFATVVQHAVEHEVAVTLRPRFAWPYCYDKGHQLRNVNLTLDLQNKQERKLGDQEDSDMKPVNRNATRNDLTWPSVSATLESGWMTSREQTCWHVKVDHAPPPGDT